MREIPSESLDELRTWPNDRLLAARDDVLVIERRARLARMDIDRALDERGATNGRDATEWLQSRDKVSAHTARGEVEVSRALESLPAIRAAAEDGKLSLDQLESVVQLATPDTDDEWAVRAQQSAPSELNRLVRRQRAVSSAEMEARAEAKAFRWWRTKDGTGLRLTGEIYDIDAAYVEAMLEHEIETMKPARGQPWAPRGRRGAEALVAICRRADGGTATRGWKPTVVVHVGSDTQPAVNGMPIDIDTMQRLIDDGARVREVHDDDLLAPATGDAIPAALREYLAGRDATCRVPGCGRPFGLAAHHIVPRSSGGRTDKHNVVLVCTTHHHRLIPHGPWVLDGDPEQPDGLRWHGLDDGGIDQRAGPAA